MLVVWDDLRFRSNFIQFNVVNVVVFQDVDLNHCRIGKLEGFDVLKKVKVRLADILVQK